MVEGGGMCRLAGGVWRCGPGGDLAGFRVGSRVVPRNHPMVKPADGRKKQVERG